jgi:MFS family permease
MRTYLDFIAIPGVKRLLVSAIPGRLAYAMIALATFFFVQDTTGSITLAGLATGAETITSSLTAGIRGNLIDKLGQTKPLSIFVPTWVTLVIAFSFVSTPTAIVVMSALIGLASPPINLATRPLWRTLVDAENLRTAYSIDTTLSSSTVVAGPVIATAIALPFGGHVALWVTAAFMTIGGYAVMSMPASRKWQPEPQPSSAFSLLRNPQFKILAIEGAVFGIAWGLLEISIPAFSTLQGTPGLSAPLLATLAGASIVGGLIIGGLKSNVTPLRGFKISSAAASTCAIPLALTHPGWSMAMVLAGLGLALGFAQVYHWEVLEAVRPQGTATSAQAWLWAVEGSMLAVGTALGGYLVDHVSPQIALLGVSVGLIASTAYIWIYASPRLPAANKPLSDEQLAEVIADLESPAE